MPHIDDLGGSHGANAAMMDLSSSGAVTSGSVMVPAAWFPECASMARENEMLDLGVHLTLNSESEAFRWRPLTTADRRTGLIDQAGYMWATVPVLRKRADPAAVKSELRAQIEEALEAGIDVTHLDSHMGAALCPEFAEGTVDLAIEFGLPLVFPAELAGFTSVVEVGEVDLEVMEQQRRRASDGGVAFGDRFVMPLFHRHEGNPLDVMTRLLSETDPGISYLSLHCAAPGEISLIHPADADWRIGEHALFSEAEFVEWLSQQFTISDMRRFRGADRE